MTIQSHIVIFNRAEIIIRPLKAGFFLHDFGRFDLIDRIRISRNPPLQSSALSWDRPHTAFWLLAPAMKESDSCWLILRWWIPGRVFPFMHAGQTRVSGNSSEWGSCSFRKVRERIERTTRYTVTFWSKLRRWKQLHCTISTVQK